VTPLCLNQPTLIVVCERKDHDQIRMRRKSSVGRVLNGAPGSEELPHHQLLRVAKGIEIPSCPVLSRERI